ncbi:MAG: ribonuclease H-like domain-containing protein [Candidatus Peribacteraceae bacterium]|nr:ribonuclease H-like domain-containing protein [Candidatus Peribacteraceae bacterium]
MQFKNLTKRDIDLIRNTYEKNPSRKNGQMALSTLFDVDRRTIRKWAKKLGIGVLSTNIVDPAKIMIYDIETPRVKFWAWRSGKQFLNGNDLVDEPNNDPRIITVAWKWFGDNKIHTLRWDKDQSDKILIKEFLKEYNKADMVVGINNDKFDNRWINARASKYGFYVNMHVKSLDLQKQARRFFWLPSYALKFLCRHFNVTMKLSHEGIIMWEKIQTGTEEEQEEYLRKMEEYNRGDIVSTEEVYLKMIPYLNHVSHLGIIRGGEKHSCKHCGGDNIELVKTVHTAAGTIQRIMRCRDDGAQYKLSNREYLKFVGNA